MLVAGRGVPGAGVPRGDLGDVQGGHAGGSGHGVAGRVRDGGYTRVKDEAEKKGVRTSVTSVFKLIKDKQFSS